MVCEWAVWKGPLKAVSSAVSTAGLTAYYVVDSRAAHSVATRAGSRDAPKAVHWDDLKAGLMVHSVVVRLVAVLVGSTDHC